MTAEVAVINVRGVALAADSAVTIGGGDRVYNTSSKMARLNDVQPVGIMTYGNAMFLGFNWDLVFNEYRRLNGDIEFDSIADYGHGFLEFLASDQRMFPSEEKRQWMARRIRAHVEAALDDYQVMMRALASRERRTTPRWSPRPRCS